MEHRTLHIQIDFSPKTQAFLRSLFGKDDTPKDKAPRPLSKREKEFVDLRNYGHDPKVIAQKCGVTLQHVHATLQRADVKLVEIEHYREQTFSAFKGIGFEEFMTPFTPNGGNGANGGNGD